MSRVLTEVSRVPVEQAGMGLLVSALPDASTDWCLNLLKQSSAELRVGAVVEPFSLERMLEVFPDVQAVAIYRRPEAAVAQAIVDGRDPEQLLEEWRLQIETLLGVYRAHRGRLALVDADAARAQPRDFVGLLADHLGLALEAPEHADGGGEPPARVVETAIAYLAVVRSRDLSARHLMGELEASSLALQAAADFVIPSASAVAHEYQKMRASAALSIDLAREIDMLLLQMLQIQDELEGFYVQNQEAGERNREMEALLGQYKLSSEELESKLLAQEERLHEQEERLNMQARKLELLRRSISWRLTLPLRWVSRLFSFHKRKTLA